MWREEKSSTIVILYKKAHSKWFQPPLEGCVNSKGNLVKGVKSDRLGKKMSFKGPGTADEDPQQKTE